MNKRKYKINDIIGDIKIIDYTDNSEYIIKCLNCGNISTETSSFLSRAKNYGHVSCRNCTTSGRYSVKIGDKLGFLTVIEKVKNYVILECCCGNKLKIKSTNFKTRTILACGECNLWEPKWKRKYGNIPITYYERIQYQAEKRGIEFGLHIKTLACLFDVQKGKCALTGLEIGFCDNLKDGNTASLDRINPEKGYFIDNVHWVHSKINLLKNRLQNDEFISLCKLVADHDRRLIK